MVTAALRGMSWAIVPSRLSCENGDRYLTLIGSLHANGAAGIGRAHRSTPL